MADDTTNQTGDTSTGTKAKAAKGANGAKGVKGSATTPASRLRIVRSTLKPLDDGGDKVVLHEFDKRHPNGEVFIAGATPVEVFPTPAVSALVQQGTLKDVTNGDDDDDTETEE